MTETVNTGAVEANQEELAVGLSEHDKEMLAKVEEAEGKLQERPDWLPEKFKDAAQMAEAYAALETKLGQGSSNEEAPPVEEAGTAETESTPSAEAAPNEVSELLESKGLEFDRYQTEYDENGGLSETALAELAEAGLPESLVNSWIAGQEALVADYEAAVFDTVGGQENYSELIKWATENLSQGEAAAFDRAVDSKDLDMVKLAVSGLQTKYQAAEGSTPQLLQGDASQTSTGGAFSSVAEMSAAMRDPRYTNDANYRQQVAEKLSRSNIL